MIYPVDSATQRLNNRDQIYNPPTNTQGTQGDRFALQVVRTSFLGPDLVSSPPWVHYNFILHNVPTQAEYIMRGIFRRGKHKLSTFRFPSAFTDKWPGYVVHKQM